MREPAGKTAFVTGVSVLCPGFVRTRIGESGRNRPARYGPAAKPKRAGGHVLTRRATRCARRR